MHVEGVGDGDHDTNAHVRLGCFYALQEGQVDARQLGELFLCQVSSSPLTPDVGGNVP